MRNYLPFVTLLAICILSCYTAQAQFSQFGELDTTFNFGKPHSFFATDPRPGQGAGSSVRSLALQPDGKVIIGGDFTYYNGTTRNQIARLNADGSLDTTFNPGIGPNDNIYSLVLQPDGKVIIGGLFTSYNGTACNRIARLNADGSLDATFNLGTGVMGTIYSLALQPDGKVIIGGQFYKYNNTTRNSIARLNTDGSLDATFDPGTGTGLIGAIRAIVLQPDGKVIIGGQFNSYNDIARNRIARLNADGSLDTTFNPGTGVAGESSFTVPLSIFSLALQPNGKVIIGGSFTSYNGITLNRIARLNTDGSLDATFNSGTGAEGDSFSYISSLIIQPDEKVIIGGLFTNYNGISRNYIARLNTDGSLDTTFNSGTGVIGSVLSLALQPNGKVIIGGHFSGYFNGMTRDYIARLNVDGIIDANFNPTTGADNTISALTLQLDGKVIIGGDFTSYNGISRNRIARLNTDGSLDTTFDPGTGANTSVWALALQPDGKVIIGGSFSSYNGSICNGANCYRVARLNADGSLDATFSPGIYVDGSISSLALQPDGKVIIGGSFTSYNGTLRNRIARLNSDGSLDITFDPGTGAEGGSFPYIPSLALQPDGKIIIGGEFTTYNGISRRRIARLNSDGSLDITFNPGTGADGLIGKLALQPDGKVIIGGGFTRYNNIIQNGITRLNVNGSLDTTFNPEVGVGSSLLALQPDGKVIIGITGTLARLNSDGSLDAIFNSGMGMNGSITSLVLQSDGKAIIGGAFTSYNSIYRSRIARIFSPNCPPIVAPIISTPAAICEGTTATITPTGGTTYRFYATPTGGNPLAGGNGVTSFTTPNLTTTTTYYVASVSRTGCQSSTRTSVIITVDLPIAPTVSTPAAICAGFTATITPTAGGASYRFYATSTGGSPLVGGNGVASFTTPNLITTTTYYVASVSATGCESSTRTSVTVTVDLPSAPTVSIPIAICMGFATTITPTAGGASYRFYATPTGGNPLVGGNGVASYTTPNLTTTTTYYVASVSAVGCESSTRTSVTVTVNPLPSPPPIVAPATICAGLTATITPTAGGASYRFYATSTGGSPLAGGNGVTSYITPNLTITTTYYVASVSAAGCESSTRTSVTVTVNPLPVVTISQLGDTLIANTVTGAYQWFRNDVAIAGATGITFIPTQPGVYTLKVMNSQGCIGLSNSINVIITSLNTQSLPPDWLIYPVPFRNEFTIKANASFQYEVLNMQGVVQLKGFTKTNEVTCFTRDLANGMYLVKITLNNQTYIQKVVKE